MTPDNPYPPEDRRMSDGEIRARQNAILERLDHIRDEVIEVKVEVRATNGRVRALESWRDRIVGALLILALIEPVAVALIIRWLEAQ